MNATTPPKPPSIVEHLRTVLALGVQMSSNPDLSPLGSNSWIMKARALLARVYGDTAVELDFWCPLASSDPPSTTPQNKVISRLPGMERFAEIIAVSSETGKIFIGHGRSSEWLKLRAFLSEKLSLLCDEFNIEATAGLQTANRIETMLTSARMAFLVTTAEDEHTDGTRHPRANVIHEIGLFQAKLGSRRAIVLLEAGCSRFSNLDGLTTINFPINDVMARSEEIRGVLAREHLI